MREGIEKAPSNLELPAHRPWVGCDVGETPGRAGGFNLEKAFGRKSRKLTQKVQ
jgi:hypothetical protein